jgi:hypothetical protein
VAEATLFWLMVIALAIPALAAVALMWRWP